jgi:CubicO group peptidase (beta-lactamase class C family)
MKHQIKLILCLALVLAGCATPRVSREVFRPDKLAEMDQAINTAIANHKCPGGVLWLERDGDNAEPLGIYRKAYGWRSLVPKREKMTINTIFDLASLTKVVATTPSIMLLIQRGEVKLDAPVKDYIPEFTGDGRDKITVRELLTHTSGLPPDIENKTDWHGWNTAIHMACTIPLESPPGTVYRYSDINFELLGEIVRRVSGVPLQDFVQREIFQPLKMNDTGFLPPKSKRYRIAPTALINGKPLCGIVEDPTARHMGGVAGHAGLFSTAHDLARYARMMLNMGELDGVRIFKPETVKLMTSMQMPPGIDILHGLGWDIDSPYAGPRGSLFPLGSYGHTGWTGTSLWIDPFSKTFIIFLANRTYPTSQASLMARDGTVMARDGSVIALRRKLGNLAAEAVIGFDFTNVPGALKPLTK